MGRHPLGLLLLCLVLLLTAAPVLAQSDDAVNVEAREIAKQLQCPICQGLSVADSPSELATQMRGLIRDKVAAGESREQILQYFVDRYGESILEEPPHNGFTITAWVMPYIGILAAIGFLVWRVTRKDPPAAEEQPLEGDVEEQYLAEVDRTYDRLRDEALR